MPNRRVGSLVYQYLPVINGVPALLIPNGTGRGATRNRVCFYNGIILTVNISPPFHLRWRAYGNRACTTQARPPGVRGKPTILIFASNHARASTRFSLSLLSVSFATLPNKSRGSHPERRREMNRRLFRRRQRQRRENVSRVPDREASRSLVGERSSFLNASTGSAFTGRRIVPHGPVVTERQ